MTVNLNFLRDDVKPVKGLIKRWISDVIKAEGSRLGEINIIFVSDEYLLDLNKKYLNHSFFTDVITFDYCNDSIISGDIFISVDRVRENGEIYKQGIKSELLRVIVHGILHLLGYKDKTKEEKNQMRDKENLYLLLAIHKFDLINNGFK